MTRRDTRFMAWPGGRPNQLWASAPLDEPHGHWLLVLGFRVEGGITDLASVTLCPRGQGSDHEQDNFLGDVARLLGPRLGERTTGSRLTSRIIRSAAVSELEREARAWAPHDWAFRPGQAGDDVRKPRGGRGDARLAEVADRYVTLSNEVADPVRQLADELGLAGNTISSYLWRARERGLLTSAGQGKVGGVLTPRALALIAEEDH